MSDPHDVADGVDLGRDAAVDAEELLVDDGGQGQGIEQLQAGKVQGLTVLHLT